MRKSVVESIPGGWYGSDPGFMSHLPQRGIVVVSPYTLLDSLKWLARRARVLSTAIDIHNGQCGIVLHYDAR